ncbi:MAG: glycoside hydrolase family 3 C-terminal domain-containing protein, partial [Bacteroidota bacterium]
KGVQNENVIATVKHFVANNQEWKRRVVDVQVDERTLREIYLPAFKAAVQQADVWSVMSAYNKVNGTYSSENKVLLNDILKDEWGFEGFVVSDWGATQSTIPSALAGLDLEMPSGEYFGEDLLKALKNGKVDEEIIDDKVRRILRIKFRAGLFDKNENTHPDTGVFVQHRSLVREAAAKSFVLLKNDNNILPLQRDEIKNLAVIGPNAKNLPTGGGGSSEVRPPYVVSPLEALKEYFNDDIVMNYAIGDAPREKIIYGPGEAADKYIPPVPSEYLSYTENKSNKGLTGEYFNNRNLSGEPVFTRIDEEINFNWGDDSPSPGLLEKGNYSIRWSGKLLPPISGIYRLKITSEDGMRIFLDGELLYDNWHDHGYEVRSVDIQLEKNKSYDLKIEYYNNNNRGIARFSWLKPKTDYSQIKEAVEIARDADIVLLFAGFDKNFEHEGYDRVGGLGLPGLQTELIKAVSEVNSNIVIVLNNGTSIAMDDWIDNVPAILETWYPGQEGGNAIVDVLFGKLNPSGKLPFTFIREKSQSPAFDTYMAKDVTANYSEGIFVGYRYIDKNQINPQFHFGHGLSYTNFEYSDLQTFIDDENKEVTVSFSLSNTGERKGAEIAQLYVSDLKSSLERPLKELKGFQKTELNPGETKRVSITLNKDAFSFFDPNIKKWRMEKGQFEIMIGSSSADLRLMKTIEMD